MSIEAPVIVPPYQILANEFDYCFKELAQQVLHHDLHAETTDFVFTVGEVGRMQATKISSLVLRLAIVSPDDEQFGWYQSYYAPSAEQVHSLSAPTEARDFTDCPRPVHELLGLVRTVHEAYMTTGSADIHDIVSRFEGLTKSDDNHEACPLPAVSGF